MVMRNEKNGDSKKVAGKKAIAKAVKVVSEDLLAQHKYADRLLSKNFDFSLVVADAFVRGMRDIGYKSTGTALDELLDNSIQAEAEKIRIVFGHSGSQKRVDKIAIIDDGHGMPPLMVRASVLWGGTHREGNRKGFGRYGYGLPSATLSQGERYTIYSKEDGGEWHAVTIDVKDISEGKYTNSNGRVVAPEASEEEPPEWVMEEIEKGWPKGYSHGTIVVLERLDRLTYKTTDKLKGFLLEHFGVVYRNFLREVEIFVDGTIVEPVDPLFITPGFRYYDLDEDRAEALEPLTIDVKDPSTREVQGRMKVRFSYMPPTFARVPEDKLKERGKNNPRFPIMVQHNGIIILRNGRQIDVVTSKNPWTVFVNYDRYWGVEVDFEPTLDEEFSITTSKQQVVVSDRIWEILKKEGVQKSIEQMRSRYKRENAELTASREEEEEKKRASEASMEEARKFKNRKSADPAGKKERARKKLEEEARKRARATGKSYEQAEHEVEQETQKQPYKVKRETLPGAPFYRVEQIGGQQVLYLNVAHRFFTDVYVGPGSTPRLRAAMEILLFVMGDCELDANGERRMFYETERAEWSKLLAVGLDRLNEITNVEDENSAQMNEGDAADAAATAVAAS